MKSKVLSLLLSVIMIFSVFTSCAPMIDEINGSSDLGTNNVTENIGSNNETTSNDSTDNNNNNKPEQGTDSNNKDTDKTLALYKNKEQTVSIVKAKSSDSLNKTICNNIGNLLKKHTGKELQQVTSLSSSDAPAILIGKTSQKESDTLYKTLKNNQAKAEVIGNKYVIAYSNEAAAVELFVKLKELASRYIISDKTVIDEKWNVTVNTVGKINPDAANGNLVMAGEQLTGRIVIYDFNKYTTTKSLDQMEVKSFNLGHTSDVKYRTGTIFGDVLIITGSVAEANTGIYSYSTGKAIWKTSNPAKNPHAIEILPSGNIVIASSTDNKLRLFKTSALKSSSTSAANSYVDYELEDAHGVLWDPTYRVLWALGRYELRAYYIAGSGTSENLVEATEMRITLPEGHRGGHDLSPDYTNTRYLYITVGEFALKIDKQEHKLMVNYEYSNIFSARNIKGFSNNPLGNFFITGEIGTTSYSTSTTNSIYYCRYNGTTYEKIKLTSSKVAIYKARSFCGTYQ